MHLHVIIPVVNEAENLASLLPYLQSQLNDRGHVTVADGGSTDGIHAVMRANPAVSYLRCSRRGRAQQMNEAVWNGDNNGGVVYFVHADTKPPEGFYNDIVANVAGGYPVGCYRFKFDMFHPLLSINAFCTRFRGLACRGGDQSLYLTRQAFDELGGYRDMQIMEDYDIIQRVWACAYNFRVMPRDIMVSARKYRVNGWLRVQLANLRVFRMYRAGADQQDMVSAYRSMLDPW